MKKKVLVTGGLGFLGRSVAKKYYSLGHDVFGIGHGSLTKANLNSLGYTSWHEGDISFNNLERLNQNFDIIIHCASNSSVSHSLKDPDYDYKSSVNLTNELIKYIKSYSNEAHLIYPSSAAVYGKVKDAPIIESSNLNPVSPYGQNKLAVEQLLVEAQSSSNIQLSIIRFFSIYGSGQKKQLLWDAINKLIHDSNFVTFSGTGEETRDWIHIEDASNLIALVSNQENVPLLLNGASGNRITVSHTLNELKELLEVSSRIIFNGKSRAGDPMFYNADISKSLKINFKTKIHLRDGISDYIKWFKNL